MRRKTMMIGAVMNGVKRRINEPGAACNASKHGAPL